MVVKLLQADVLDFLRDYAEQINRGEAQPFHGALGDPPYYLGSIVERFGDEDSAPAQAGTDGRYQHLSHGFMNQKWDGFDSPQSYQAWITAWGKLLIQCLYPGAVVMFFGGSRTFHRLASGLEDAGFVLYDCAWAWVYVQGFPKSYRVDSAASRHLSLGAVCQCDGNTYNNERTYPLQHVLDHIGMAELSEQVANAAQNVLSDLGILQDSQGDYPHDSRSYDVLLPRLARVALTFAQPQEYAQVHNHFVERGGVVAAESLHNLCLALHNDLRATQDYFPPSFSQNVSQLLRDFEDMTNPVVYLSSYVSSMAALPILQLLMGDDKLAYYRLHIHNLVFGLPLNILSVLASGDNTILSFIGICLKCGKAFSYYNGYGTALAPSYEPIVIARAPRGKYTFAQLATLFGTGALNIDGTRIATTDGGSRASHTHDRPLKGFVRPNKSMFINKEGWQMDDNGRWLKNTLLTHHPDCTDEQCVDDCHIKVLGDQSGNVKAGGSTAPGIYQTDSPADFKKGVKARTKFESYGDEGTAARFFYQSKASTWEREAGLENVTKRQVRTTYDKENRDQHGNDSGYARANTHPTVKPIRLIEQLARLMLPPIADTRLLIPFAGVGSEMIAARLAGWHEITGVELDSNNEYIPLALARLKWWAKFNSYAMADDYYKTRNESGQMTLFEALNEVHEREE